VGIAPPFAQPHHPHVPQKWNEDEKHCGVTMLDYKKEDPQKDVWELRSIIRNDVQLLKTLKCEFKTCSQQT